MANELLDYLEAATQRMVSTAKKKNNDYAGAEASDPFLNFTTVERLGIATTEQGLLTRMTDKFMRIINLTKQEAQVKDETIEDSLIDLSNYCLILAGYLSRKKRAV